MRVDLALKHSLKTFVYIYTSQRTAGNNVLYAKITIILAFEEILTSQKDRLLRNKLFGTLALFGVWHHGYRCTEL